MREAERKLSVEEAEQRAWNGVNELEGIINAFNDELGKRDDPRRESLHSQFMALLAETPGIGIPATELRGNGR